MSTLVRFATTETEAQPFVGDYSGSVFGGRVARCLALKTKLYFGIISRSTERYQRNTNGLHE